MTRVNTVSWPRVAKSPAAIAGACFQTPKDRDDGLRQQIHNCGVEFP
jgi:hypothetical protein